MKAKAPVRAAKPKVATKARTAAPAIVRDTLQSPGRALDAATRARMEQRFRFNFASVRLHDGPLAAASARAVDAAAYTVADRIVLGDSAANRPELLAHELAHVVQNRGVAVGHFADLQVAPAFGEFERQAEGAAAAIARGSNAPPQFRAPVNFLRRREAEVKKPESKEPEPEPTTDEVERLQQIPKLQKAVEEIHLTRGVEPLLSTLSLTHEAETLFKSLYKESLISWLMSRQKNDRPRLVRSLAIVIDGMDLPVHAILATTTLGNVVMEAPPILLERLSLEARQQVKKDYRHTYEMSGLSEHGLYQDLYYYYNGLYHTLPYRRTLALLNHELTDAERLSLMGAGMHSADTSSIISLIEGAWKRGGPAAIHQMTTDWRDYVQNENHWWTGPAPWSDDNLYDALKKTLYSTILYLKFGDWGLIEPYLRATADYRKESETGYANIYREIHLKTRPLMEIMSKAYGRVYNDREQMHHALLMFHEIWRNLIAGAKTDEARMRMQAVHREQLEIIDHLQLKRFEGDQTVAPLIHESPTLADEFYAGLYPGFTSRFKFTSRFSTKDWTAVQDLLLKAWGEGGERIDEMVVDARRDKYSLGGVRLRPKYDPVELILGICAVTDNRRKRMIVLLQGETNTLRGFYCLQVELAPNAELSPARMYNPDNRSALSDPELEPVHKLLTTPGVSAAFRAEIVSLCLLKTSAGGGRYDVLVNGERNEARTFMAYLAAITHNDLGDWYSKLQTLLDPTLNAQERLTRMKMRADSGSNRLTAGISNYINEVFHEDPRGAVQASMAGVRATLSARQLERMLASYGVKTLEELSAKQNIEFDARVTNLHAAEERINAVLQKTVEYVMEGALCAVLGPAWWAQLAAAVAAKVAGMGAREILSGPRYLLQSRENAKDLILTALSMILQDPIDLRGQIAKRWEPMAGTTLAKRKPEAADFVGDILINSATGVVETVATVLPTVALDAMLLHHDWDGNSLATAGNIAWSQIFGKAILPFLGSMKINPQAITDLTPKADMFKLQIGFKMMLAVPSTIKRVLDEKDKDNDFDFADFLASAASSLGQKMLFAAAIRGGGNAVARNRTAERNVAQRKATHGELDRLSPAGYRVLGEAVKRDPKLMEKIVASEQALLLAGSEPASVPAIVSHATPPKGVGNTGADHTIELGRRFEAMAALAKKPSEKAAPHKALLADARLAYGEDTGTIFGGNKNIPVTKTDAERTTARAMVDSDYRGAYEKARRSNPELTPQQWADQKSKTDTLFRKNFKEHTLNFVVAENMRRGVVVILER